MELKANPNGHGGPTGLGPADLDNLLHAMTLSQPAHLFEPLRLRGLTLPHRVLVSPMCQVLERGWICQRLALRAPRQSRGRRRGPGVHRGRGRDSRRAHQPSGPGHLERRACRARSAASSGSSSAGQRRGHAARARRPERRARTGRGMGHGAVPPPRKAAGKPVGPTGEPFADNYPTPRPMTVDDIAAIVEAFRDAARRRARRPASTSSRFTPRTATCSTSSCRRSRTREPTSTAARSTTGFACVSRSWTRSAACWPERAAAVRAYLGDRLGRRAAGTSTSPSSWRAASRDRGVDLIDCSSGGNVDARDDSARARATRCRSPNGSGARPGSRPARSA